MKKRILYMCYWQPDWHLAVAVTSLAGYESV